MKSNFQVKKFIIHFESKEVLFDSIIFIKFIHK
jgi:hypothetical protein